MTDSVIFVEDDLTVYYLPEEGIVVNDIFDIFYNLRWHRYNGPAWINRTFVDEDSWHILGYAIDKVEYTTWLIQQGMDINNLTDTDKILIDLKWGTDGP